jgi:galactonate dehydratase
MKITGIDTILNAEYPGLIWVQVRTDQGITGLGETTFGVEAVDAFVHSEVASYLIGRDPFEIDAHWNNLRNSTRADLTRSTEIRAMSAIDVALWDILGQATGQPIHTLLGGAARDRVLIYNTCAGYRYGVRKSESGEDYTAGSGETSLNLSGNIASGGDEGPYEDMRAFLNNADDLAESLLSEGITAMKIWPFDQFYDETDGQRISLENLKRGLEPFEKIRKRVGNKIQIAAEMHSLWSMPAILRIAHALEDFDLMWIEDAIPMNNMDALADFRSKIDIPVCASETIATREAFREMFERRATDICMLDITWCGGISEAKKIATMAETYKLPVAPHDCTGPVTLMTGVHLAINLPNGFIQETVRAYNTGWYPTLVDRMPEIEYGYVYAPTAPGLGMALRPEVFTDPRTTLRKSNA